LNGETGWPSHLAELLQKCKVGICGQAPSDKPEFAAFLVSLGIDSMSLNPDSVIQVKSIVAEAEQKHG